MDNWNTERDADSTHYQYRILLNPDNLTSFSERTAILSIGSNKLEIKESNTYGQDYPSSTIKSCSFTGKLIIICFHKQDDIKFSFYPEHKASPEIEEKRITLITSKIVEQINEVILSTPLREFLLTHDPNLLVLYNQFMETLVPRNQGYWQFRLKMLGDEEVPKYDIVTSPEMLPTLRHVFQKGIAFYLSGNPKLGKQFLHAVFFHLSRMGNVVKSTGDFIIQFVSGCLVDGHEPTDLLRSAVNSLEFEASKLVIRSGSSDLFHRFVQFFPASFKKETTEGLLSSFSSSSPSEESAHEFERYADCMVLMSLLQLYMEEYPKAIGMVKQAQELYISALDYQSADNKSSDKFRHDNIPLYFEQAELIDLLATLHVNRPQHQSTNWLYKMLPLLEKFHTLLNPPDKRSQNLSLHEELMWAFVLNKFLRSCLGVSRIAQPLQILEMFLG